MPAGLTARQQRVLRGYDDWLLAWVLTSPDDGIRHAKAVTLRDGDDGELVPWTAVRAHARRLDPTLVTALAAAHVACNQHRATYRQFAATGPALGCGPAPRVGPLTYARHLYDEQYAAWEWDVHGPWQQRRDALEAERGALLDRCLPLACADEPPGLFELAP